MQILVIEFSVLVFCTDRFVWKNIYPSPRAIQRVSTPCKTYRVHSDS
jgi:hypothetical protein